MKIILLEGVLDEHMNTESVMMLAESACGPEWTEEADLIIGVSTNDAKCFRVSPFKTLPARPEDIEIAYEVV